MRAMHALHALATPLAAALLAAAAVTPAAAQATAAQAAAARPAAAFALDAAPRPVATYRFTQARDGYMPTELVIADSAGVLSASFRLPGERAPRPMAVDATEYDLVLQGETPAGLLTLRFYLPREAAEAGVVAGRWWLGEESGTLRGRVTR